MVLALLVIFAVQIKITHFELQQVLRAERLLKKWEAELGLDMKSVNQDLFGLGGRLEGLKSHELAIGERDFEVCIEPLHNLMSLNFG